MNPRLIFLFAIVAVAGVGVASGAVLYTLTINGSFSVTVPVQSVTSLATATASIGFGDLSPGEHSGNYTVTIANTGNTIAKIHVSATGLPAGVTLAVYKGLDTYVQGSPLAVGASVSLKLQLIADASITVSVPSTQFQIRCTAET